MYNIVQNHIRNEAIMLQDFHRNSPDGRLGKHPLQGRWEGYMETFQYNQELGAMPIPDKYTNRKEGYYDGPAHRHYHRDEHGP
jgi:hypothetical protein